MKPVEVTVRVGKTDNKKGKNEKTVTVPAMIVEESSRGMLVWRKFLIQNRVCLNDGINTIGRKYDGEPTTVAINDKYISRNSAVINVINSERGTTFQFVVKKTKNPILVSGRQVKVGEIIYLHFGDTIQMGHTVLTFKTRFSATSVNIRVK